MRRQWLRNWKTLTVVAVIFLAVVALAAYWDRDSYCVRWATRVDRLVARLPMSVSVADRGRIVYAHAGDVQRPPASDEKLLLSMALLDRFGARYRIPTTVEGPPSANGSVRGNLWLVGHGDPELDDAALVRLARRLRAAGSVLLSA